MNDESPAQLADEASPTAQAATIPAVPDADEAAADVLPAATAWTAPPVAVAPVATVAAPVVAVAAPPVAPARPAAPFALDAAQLRAIAESAGLQWIGSDAEKIRAAQEAMAREPQPVHVPREPKPVVLPDDGPLVLVETRKDLSQIKLPFESAAH